MSTITFEDFHKVEIRVGRVVGVDDFPKARVPAYKLSVDFGEFGIKKSSAQITKLYTKEELEGRLVLAVTNFPPKQIADIMSEILVLGVVCGEGEVALIGPDREVSLGTRIS